MEKILNLDYHEDRWVDGNWSEQDLIDFEDKCCMVCKPILPGWIL